MVDIYRTSKNLEVAIKKLEENTSVSQKNKQDILKFVKERGRSGKCRKLRQYQYVKVLQNLAIWLEKDFEKAAKEDIESLIDHMDVAEYKGKKYLHGTKTLYKAILKTFYKWLEGDEEEYPKKVKWISTNGKTGKRLPEEILTKEEVRKLVKATTNPRDKSFVAFMYESGCRIGEILGMQIKHIEWNKYGAKIRVFGKTGGRTIPVVESVGYLKAWLDNHPGRNNPDSWLWVNISNNCGGNRVVYMTVNIMLRKAAKKADVKKAVNPHSFRHARATHLAPDFTDAQMRWFFGWENGSPMPSLYTHLSAKDIEDKYLSLYGLAEEEKRKGDVVLCSRCRADNKPEKSFCGSCGMPLSLKVAVKVQEELDRYNQFMNGLLPKAVEKIPEFKQMVLEELKMA